MTAAAGIPHARIRELRDRSWTLELVQALHGADDDERSLIARTLANLADPRAVPGLTAMVVSPSGPRELRELASAILRDQGEQPPAHVVRHWWEAGDRVLRRHALRSMPSPSAEVLEVARDPGHPLHADSIGQLTFGYEEPEHQRLKIAALAHPDPRVRVAGGDALVIDEPVAAEDALIAALEDAAPEVALAARATLVYYDSRRALRALASVPAPAGAEELTVEAGLAFANAMRGAGGAVRQQLRSWLRPVADLVAELLASAEAEAEAGRVTSPAGEAVRSPDEAPPDADEIHALLTIEDGPWALPRTRLAAVDAAAVPADARRAIARHASEHADPDVRALATRWLAAWGDEERLRELVDDDAGLVRKAAVFELRALPRSPALATLLREHLDRPDVAGAHALETLASYAVHELPGELVPLLAALAAGDRRESVRAAAIELLTERGAREALAPMMARLAEAPRVTWAVHVALLEAARRLALPAPEAAALVAVDSLRVQLALAELATAV